MMACGDFKFSSLSVGEIEREPMLEPGRDPGWDPWREPAGMKPEKLPPRGVLEAESAGEALAVGVRVGVLLADR